MAIIINEGYDVNAAAPIDKRLVVNTVDGTTESLVSLIPQYNYPNMYVWVKEEKAFYYLKDIVDDLGNPGATVSDWEQASGGGSGCAKSGYVSGASFTGNPATASVVFSTPYSSASYSVVVTSHAFNNDDYVYSITNKTENGFIIRVDLDTTPPLGGPIGATAMWITNCWDGSGLSSGGAAGSQGPTGPGGGSAIDLEEIAFGTGTGITSSDVFTFDNSNTSLILGFDNTITDSRSSAIIGGTGNTINSSTKGVFIDSNLITSARSSNVEDSFYSSIQSSLDSKICSSTASSIITSCNTTLNSSCYSTIIGSYGYKNLQIPNGLSGSCFSTLIGTYTSFINNSRYSSMINTCGGCIQDTRYASIFLGSRSCIVGKGVDVQSRSLILNGDDNQIYKSKNVSIINSQTSCIFSTVGDSSFSNIFGGSFIRICNSNCSNSIGGCNIKINDSLNSNSIGGWSNKIYDSCNSGIIGSFKSSMTASNFNSIFYSSNSQIVGNSHNTIISSTGSSIVSYSGFSGTVNLCNSVIIGGSGHCIRGAKNSAIIGGVDRCLVRCAIGGSGINDGFDNVVALPSIMGCASLALGIATSSTDGIILDDNYFTLIAYPPQPSGTMDVCLPSVSSYIIGRIYVIKKNGSSTQSKVNVCPYGSNCIDGYAGYVELINPWDYYMLQADGVDNWLKLGGAVGINL